MTRDHAVAAAIVAWFRESARDLPWRTSPRRAWPSFVSEAMLQQTQVSRVLEKFAPFLERFPTPHALARANEDDVLSAWQGLGYYRRARHLQAAARAIVEHHDGVVPADPAHLRALPGVGRYTAGAVASIVFGRVEPIVDGNVSRVLVRLEGRELRAGAPDTEKWAWSRAGALVEASPNPAALNEGLMELGATVCTPRSPRCDACPLLGDCRAAAAGTPEAFPLPKKAARVRDTHHALVLVRDVRGRALVVRRPDSGLWARLWQPVGLERDDHPADEPELRAALAAEGLRPAGTLTHLTSHRAVRLGVWTATAAAAPPGARWVTRAEADACAMPSPHRRLILRYLSPDRHAK